ncbi:hypothetical protein AHF37_00982 [Paragonimus kellicotti]|nr:hypothetical protein AHF37_00982 [Paragonimus kellicotti]
MLAGSQNNPVHVDLPYFVGRVIDNINHSQSTNCLNHSLARANIPRSAQWWPLSSSVASYLACYMSRVTARSIGELYIVLYGRMSERSLVVDGYKFTKSRDGMCNRVFWRCSRRECKATAVTVADRVEHIRAVHSHEPPVPAEFFADHSVQYEQEVKFNNIVNTQRPRARRRSQPGRLVSQVVFEGFGRTSEGDQPCDSYDPWLTVPNDSNKEVDSKVFELISPDKTPPARTPSG